MDDSFEPQIKRPPVPRPRNAWPDASRSSIGDSGSRPPPSSHYRHNEQYLLDEPSGGDHSPPVEMMPDAEMLQQLFDRFQRAVAQNDELKAEIVKMNDISSRKIEEAAGAVKRLKSRHTSEVETLKSRHVSEVEKLGRERSELIKQFEDAKIVILSYKSKKIELTGAVKSFRDELKEKIATIAQLESRVSQLQHDKSGSTRAPPMPSLDSRQILDLQKDCSALTDELRNYKTALELKELDIQDLLEKRAGLKESNERTSAENDRLHKEKAEFKYRYDEIASENSANKKEVSTLRQKLSLMHTEAMDLSRNLLDTKQQLKSLNVSAGMVQEDRDHLSQSAQKQYEEDLMRLKEDASKWKLKFEKEENKVLASEDTTVQLQEEIDKLQTIIESLKMQLDRKVEEARGILHAQSSVDIVAVERKLSQKEKELVEVRERCESEKKKMQREVASLCGQLEDSQRAREMEKKSVAREMEMKSVASEGNATGFDRQKVELLKKLDASTEKLERARKEVQSLQLDNEDLLGDKQKLEGYNRALDARNEEARSEMEALQRKNFEVESVMQQEMSELSTTVEELKLELSDKERAIALMRDEKTRQERQLEELQAHCRSLMSEKADKEEALQGLEHEMESQTTGSQHTIDGLYQENARKEEKLKKFKTELKRCAKELEDFEKDSLGLRDGIYKLQEEKKEIICRLEDAKANESLLRAQVKQFKADFDMEIQSHTKTAQDRDSFRARFEELNKQQQQRAQHHQDPRQSNLAHMFEAEPEFERRPNQPNWTTQDQSFSRTGERAGGILPPGQRAGGIPPPAHPTTDFSRPAPQPRRDPPNFSPLHQQPKREVDNPGRRYPCPICGRTFPELDKLQLHASGCIGT